MRFLGLSAIRKDFKLHNFGELFSFIKGTFGVNLSQFYERAKSPRIVGYALLMLSHLNKDNNEVNDLSISTEKKINFDTKIIDDVIRDKLIEIV